MIMSVIWIPGSCSVRSALWKQCHGTDLREKLLGYGTGERMSLDKAIEHGKEHRKPYRGAKAVDATCRKHGSCKWCESNRKYSDKKREAQEERR